ncbi:MAG: CsgG/HfaB family protein [Myxococcota bacterium]
MILWWVALALAAPRVAVMDLQNRTGDASLDGAGAGVAGVLLSKLVRVDTLEVVERDRLEDVLGEIALGKSGVVDPATVAKAGKVLGATHLVLGEIVSVKLPTVAIALRIVEVQSGKVVAATDVVGEVGADGGEFFVLVDDAAFRIVDALQVQLGAKDRIELGQVEVQRLATVKAYGDALRALDRGDAAAAQARLSEALAVEPGFRLAEDALAKVAAEVAAARKGYAHAAITRVHAAWEAVEKAVAVELPASPATRDLAIAAVRARMKLVRGDLDGYLKLEEARVARTTEAHVKEGLHGAVGELVTDDYVRNRTLSDLQVRPWEVRLQMAEVLLLLGRKDAAAAAVVANYQRPGPLLSPTSRPRDPGEWGARKGLADLAVLGARQALQQARLRGREGAVRDALRDLEAAVEEATEAREARARWDAVAARLAKEKASTSLLDAERNALTAPTDDVSLALAGYRAFRARVDGGYYAAVRDTSAFRELAERWRNVASGAWDRPWFVDQRLGVLLEHQATVPARDAEDEERRRKAVEDFVTGAYGR